MLKSKNQDELRQRCSEVTLQSESQGHFGGFVKMIADNNPGCLEVFRKLDTDEERVFYCSNLNRIDHMIVKPIFKPKNQELAKSKRLEGNEAFQKKNYKQAMMLYTISAMKSPNSNKDTTLAYSVANRSACFYHLGDIESCLKDVDYALKCGYPAELHYKLFERKAKCYILLEQYDSAKALLKKARKCFEASSSQMDENKKSQTNKSFKEIQDAISSKKQLVSETILVDSSNKTIPIQPKLSQGSNKKMQNLSRLVKVDYQPEVGRHVVASKPIEAGDTLAVEDPFAAVLYTDKLGTNCDQCFNKVRTAVPCTCCAGVAYCCVACRDAAALSYHKYECQFADLLLGLGCSALVRLAYRIVASQSWKFFNNIRHLLNVDETRTEIDSLALNYNIPGVIKETYLSYLNLFNLVGLDSERSVEDQFNRAMMSLCLLKILKATNYFPQKSDPDTFTSDEIFIGSLFMRHMNVLQFNAHEIYEFYRGDKNNLKPNKSSLIGVGVYPQSSYFNHSCHPGTSRYNIGKKMILKSLMPISVGQEVSENYGPVFYFKSKKERQKHLNGRYWFSCDCPACLEDWPLLKDAIEIKLKEDQDVSSLEALTEKYQKACECMDEGECGKAVENLTEYINKAYKVVDAPLEEVIRAEDKLRTCFNNQGTVLFQDSYVKTNNAEK